MGLIFGKVISMSFTMTRAVARLFVTPVLFFSALTSLSFGQYPSNESGVVSNASARRVGEQPTTPGAGGSYNGLRTSTVSLYYDPLQGSSSSDLVRRALASNPKSAQCVLISNVRARACVRQPVARIRQ